MIDGAKNELDAKLKLLSNATAKAGIVRRAEEHAEELMKLAMDFQMYVTRSWNHVFLFIDILMTECLYNMVL